MVDASEVVGEVTVVVDKGAAVAVVVGAVDLVVIGAVDLVVVGAVDMVVVSAVDSEAVVDCTVAVVDDGVDGVTPTVD